MIDPFISYMPTIYVMAAMGALLLIQLVIVDLVGIRERHVPGTAAPEDHGNRLFRVTRAFANTNESVTAFILIALFAMFSASSPTAVNLLAGLYLIGRIVHMLSYYVGASKPRAIGFGLGLVSLILMFGFALFT